MSPMRWLPAIGAAVFLGWVLLRPLPPPPEVVELALPDATPPSITPPAAPADFVALLTPAERAAAYSPFAGIALVRIEPEILPLVVVGRAAGANGVVVTLRNIETRSYHKLTLGDAVPGTAFTLGADAIGNVWLDGPEVHRVRLGREPASTGRLVAVLTVDTQQRSVAPGEQLDLPGRAVTVVEITTEPPSVTLECEGERQKLGPAH